MNTLFQVNVLHLSPSEIIQTLHSSIKHRSHWQMRVSIAWHPNHLIASNNQTARVDPRLVPLADNAVRHYEEAGGHWHHLIQWIWYRPPCKWFYSCSSMWTKFHRSEIPRLWSHFPHPGQWWWHRSPIFYTDCSKCYSHIIMASMWSIWEQPPPPVCLYPAKFQDCITKSWLFTSAAEIIILSSLSRTQVVGFVPQ